MTNVVGVRRLGVLLLAPVLLLASLGPVACGDSTTTDPGGGSPDRAQRVRVEAVPPGDQCPTGGIAIHIGFDGNGDGALSDDEIGDTELVCNGLEGTRGEQGEAGRSTLLETTPEPPGENCVEGGQQVLSGLDLNGDGVLSADEVTGRAWVCNGVGGSGSMPLVSVAEEPAGEHCQAGGQAIRWGVDSNADSTLQPGEVITTQYVCNGLDGLGSLVRQEDAPEAECPFGGRLVHSGLDDDADGYLDVDEIDATSPVCNGALASASGQSLFLIVDEPQGGVCAAGGFRIDTGLDANGDGLLGAAEIMNSRVVCESTSGRQVMHVSNAIWGGVCQRGGVRIDTGLDDDQDGTLDDAEIDATHYACNLFLTQIAAGTGHSCAVVSDGTARCWGANSFGEVGDGTTAWRTSPVAVRGLSNVARIATGGGFTCALLDDGTARCWGLNDRGQAGDGTTTTPRLTPVTVTGLSQAVDLDAGARHTCALLNDGTVRCWGSNSDGELGDGTTTMRTTPVVVSGLSRVVGLSAGVQHTCAALDDGTARCWGFNGNGQLGDGTTTMRTTPATVSVLSTVAGIVAGERHTCAWLRDGAVRCWGDDAADQLGGGSANSPSMTPVVVSGLSRVVGLSAGGFHTCAWLTDGAVSCWGANEFGQLGDGTTVWPQPRPVGPIGLGFVVGVSAAEEHTCALLDDGTVSVWGRNERGQLGIGSAASSLVPVPLRFDIAP